MKLLLAIDDSASSHAALEEIARRPWPEGTSVEALTVLESGGLWNLSETVEVLARRAGDLVNNAAERLRSDGMEATGVVDSGDAKAVILDHAGKLAADFVFVGSSGASAVERFLLGNVAAAVVRHAPCSVCVARPRPDAAMRPEPMKILLATDGSPSSQAAVRSVAERPWPAGAQVRVMSVVELILPTARALFQPPFTDSEQLDEHRQQAMKRAQDAVAAAGKVLFDANPRLNVTDSVNLPRAKPKTVILEEAQQWRPDLIVAGSHGHGVIDRFVLGSVSESVATHAECSVEVIREPPSAA